MVCCGIRLEYRINRFLHYPDPALRVRHYGPAAGIKRMGRAEVLKGKLSRALDLMGQADQIFLIQECRRDGCSEFIGETACFKQVHTFHNIVKVSRNSAATRICFRVEGRLNVHGYAVNQVRVDQAF